jgi:hypothetical protein
VKELGLDSAGARDFSLLHIIQTVTGAHAVSHPFGTGGYFPGVKQLEREAVYSFPSSATYAFME